MKRTYCLPIIKNSKSEVFESIQNSSEYDYFEVWLDYIEDVDSIFVENLISQLNGKLIVVFRRKNLEPIKTDIKKRTDILSLFNNSLAFVDLDIVSQKEELDYIQSNDLKIKKIVSYHNYQQTPADEKLSEILDTMKAYNPEIFKIATFCNNPKDALRLLGLLLAIKEKGVKCIVLGMGEHGVITRIFGSVYGNEMSFAPISKEESSADGQFTKQELESIFEILKRVQDDN